MLDRITINKLDNVDVLIEANKDIPAGHKIANQDIAKGQNIIKYGNPIGYAVKNIKKGEHVHSHNCKTNLNDKINYSYIANLKPTDKQIFPHELFGYKRFDGKVGIRNSIFIVVLVGCVNSIAKQLALEFNAKYPKCKNYDGTFAITHPYGCSQIGCDFDNTRFVLQQIVKHPNAGGVLVLGLGCENNQMDSFVETLGVYDKKRVKFVVAQESDDEYAESMAALEVLRTNIKRDKREEIQFSDLCFGLKCGGSDGFSGITANPLLGAFSDMAVACGARVVMSEVPEMFGAEHLLMNRCMNVSTFNKCVGMINKFKDYFIVNKMPIYENPSPGNKAGGITTLEEKSLGCIQKSGSTPIVDILAYAQSCTKPGISLIYGPGNDLVSTTNLGSSGANIVLFTTGRGTPFTSFTPTFKISTNTSLYNKKNRWIDFNAGFLLEGKSMEELVAGFNKKIADIVNGQSTVSENFADREISIFKQGVIL